MYTVHIAKGGQSTSKNCSLINTYNNTNNSKQQEEKKYVNINIVKNTLNLVKKRTNIFYKQKVAQNKNQSPRALLERKAWQIISEMDKYRREDLINGFEEDKTGKRWEDFYNELNTINLYFTNMEKKDRT